MTVENQSKLSVRSFQDILKITPVFQLLRCIFYAVFNSEELPKTANKSRQNKGQQSIFREIYRAEINEYITSAT